MPRMTKLQARSMSAPAWMPVRAPGRVSADDNGRPKRGGKKFLFDNILQGSFRPTNGFIIFRPSSFIIKRQTFLPGERNEHPFRDVFFELAHGLFLFYCQYWSFIGLSVRSKTYTWWETEVFGGLRKLHTPSPPFYAGNTIFVDSRLRAMLLFISGRLGQNVIKKTYCAGAEWDYHLISSVAWVKQERACAGQP